MSIFDAFFKTCDDLAAAQNQLTEICQDLNAADTIVPVTTVPAAAAAMEVEDRPIVKKEPEEVMEAASVNLPDGTLEDIGILTNAGPGNVPIIDDEFAVKLSAQHLAHQFAKGQRVRYTYILKKGCRKDIKILECNVAEKPIAKRPKEEDWNEAPIKEERVIKPTPMQIEVVQHTPAPVPPPPTPMDTGSGDEKTVQWKGRVMNCRTNTIEVRFENGCVEVIQLTPDNLAEGYEPEIDDSIVVECTTEPSDEDEEEEQLVSAILVLPASEQSSCAAITELYDDYGVIGQDIYFSKIEKDYAVGTFLEFTAVTFERDHYKWRCVTTSIAENPQRALSNNNEEYITEENLRDREGLTIVNRSELKFRMATVGLYAEKTIVFKNTSKRVLRFLNCFFYSERGRPQVRLKGAMNPRPLNPNEELAIKINAKGRFLCNYKEYAIALFTARDLATELYMVCEIPIAIGSDHIINSVNIYERQYKARTIRAPDEKKSDDLTIYRLQRSAPKFVDVRFDRYAIPGGMLQMMREDEKEFEEKCLAEYPYLVERLSPLNYAERFHHMVWISEAYLKKCFRVHDMTDVRFEKERDNFCLHLQNLAECRPSVLLGDMVVAEGGGKLFTGLIHDILTDRVLFKFHEELSEALQECRYKVSFRCSRSPFQKLHHAIDQLVKKFGEDFLFPQSVDVKEPLLDVTYDCADDNEDPVAAKAPLRQRLDNGQDKIIPWFNPELNVYQKRAIVNALRGECRPLPHLICGPPGTGKTSTLVELILQQFSMNSRSHILVCTPSNSAANLILDKLIKSETILRDQFMRVIGYQVKERELIPEEYMTFCGTVEVSKEGTEGRQMSIKENGFREDCQMEYLCQLGIIVVTIGSVGSFMQMGFPDGHFTHLYLDEAGQCMETEILIPMSLLNKSTAHMVFVGDEKQLGPVVPFDPLEKWGYGVSLFERIQKFPMYDRENPEQYDPRLCYQLVNNYRSIPSILRIYNQLFYKSTLRPMIVDETYPEFECLRTVSSIFPPSPYRTKNSGVYFYSIKSCCSRSKFNPSWINAGECQSVMRFYKNLMDCGISPLDVGIISPYQEQVRVIRSAIEAGGMDLPKIGSVEEFQGQEKMIILMSTVRSKRRKEDKEFGLGFVGNAKRINVALSRARSLVVLFGNPLVLGEDSNWKTILLNCQKQMTYFEEEPRPRT